MKERIFLCLLLATVSLLCSCSEQRYVPDSISSHAEITAKPRTTQPEKSTTLPGPEPQEKELTMIVMVWRWMSRGRIMKQLRNCSSMPKTEQLQ